MILLLPLDHCGSTSVFLDRGPVLHPFLSLFSYSLCLTFLQGKIKKCFELKDHPFHFPFYYTLCVEIRAAVC